MEIKRKMYIQILTLAEVIRLILTPVILLLAKVFKFSLYDRYLFEKNNYNDPKSIPFSCDSKTVLFEVSSEGELEQVKPLLMKKLSSTNVELVYCSDSVEKKCQALAREYENLHVLRLPLLSAYIPFSKGRKFHLSKWSQAETVYLCRYDFFPELMRLQRNAKLILLSATLKGKNKKLEKTKSLNYIWRQLTFHSFDKVVTASKADCDRFLKLGLSKEQLDFCDFRVEQIQTRLENRDQVMASVPQIRPVLEYLQSVPKECSIVIGSCWPVELEILKNEMLRTAISKGDVSLFLAPHKLGKESLDNLQSIVESHSLVSYRITKDHTLNDAKRIMDQMKEKPGVVMITVPGILCELYAYFGNAFVGGGHGRSIHSVLEPFVAGARVFCGPKTFRSTEFDLCLEIAPKEVHVIDQLENESIILLEEGKKSVDLAKRSVFVKSCRSLTQELCEKL